MSALSRNRTFGPTGHQTRVIDKRSPRPEGCCSFSSHHVAWTHLYMSFTNLTCANGFSFGCYDNNVLVNLDAVFIPEHTWQHDFCSITDGVDLQSCVASDHTAPPQCTENLPGRLTELSFITSRRCDTSSFSRGKMTLRRYVSSLLWSNCHCASRTSCMVTMLSWNNTSPQRRCGRRKTP